MAEVAAGVVVEAVVEEKVQCLPLKNWMPNLMLTASK